MLHNINETIFKAINFLIIPLMIIMSIAVVLQVILRLFGIGIIWAEEISLYCFIVFSFCGAVMSMRLGRTNTVEIFLHKLPKEIQKRITIIINASVFVFCIFMVIIGLNWSITSNQISSVLMMPMRWIYLFVPIMFFCLALIFLENLGESITILKRKRRNLIE